MRYFKKPAEGTRAVTEFPLNDQEILLRALHKVAGDYVRESRDSGKSA